MEAYFFKASLSVLLLLQQRIITKVVAQNNTNGHFMLSVLQRSGHSLNQLVSLLWVPQDVGITRAVRISGGFGEIAALLLSSLWLLAGFRSVWL